jgi:hypothetical protein
MKSREYTGKSDATQGAGPDAAAASNGPSADPDAPSDAGREAGTGGTRLPRAVLWTAVVVALAAGVALYFRYEHAVSPLFGGAR